MFHRFVVTFSRNWGMVLTVLALLAAENAQAQMEFGIPRVLNSNASTDANADTTPHLATDGRGLWAAVWAGGSASGPPTEIFVAHSRDGGRTWSEPRQVTSTQTGEAIHRFKPHIASGGAGSWSIVWSQSTTVSGRNLYVVLATHSLDGALTWSSPALVSGLSTLPISAAHAANGRGKWIVVWNASDGGTATRNAIFFSSTIDGGMSWRTPVRLSTGTPGEASSNSSPSIATDGLGIWVATWARFDGGSDVQWVRSLDDGQIWSSPAGLHAAPVTEGGQDFQPAIHALGSTWIITWSSGVNVDGTTGRDQDILFSRSIDQGKTWSRPAPLDRTANIDTATDSAPQLAAEPDGKWIAIWASFSQTGAASPLNELRMSFSADDGAVWSHPVTVHSGVDPDVNSDPAVSLATDQAGNWLAVWATKKNFNNTIGAEGDLVVASIHQPVFWLEPQPLNRNASTDTGADHNPRLATDGAGNWIAVWDSTNAQAGAPPADYDIWISRSNNNGQSWSPPAPLNTNAATDKGQDRNPVIATNRKGLWIALWDSSEDLNNQLGTDQDILISMSRDQGATWSAPAAFASTATADSANDIQPAIASDGADRWIAVWQVTGALGGDADILRSISSDGGATWGTPEPANTNAANDRGDDFTPDIKTDNAGTWIVTWFSNDSQNNTLGTDDDILFSRSTDHGRTWSNSTPLNSNAATDGSDDDDFAPQLATNGKGHWVAVWHSEGTLNNTIGTDHDILFSYSENNGLSWSSVRPLHAVFQTDSGADEFPRIDTDGQGNWIVIWQSKEPLLNETGDPTHLLLSQSNDGKSWTRPQFLVPQAPGTSSFEGFGSVAHGGNDQWVVAWSSTRNVPALFGTDADIWFSNTRIPALRVSTVAAKTVEGGEAFILERVPFSSASPNSQFIATIDWGDGTVSGGVIDLSTVSGGHIYPVEGNFIVTIRIQGANGESGSRSFPVRVVNAAPVVIAGANQMFDINQVVQLDSARFVDRGARDTHTATIEWGDGTTSLAMIDPATGRIQGSHTYLKSALYTVKIIVRDNAGAEGSDTLSMIPAFRITGMNRSMDQLTISWEGAAPPYFVQRSQGLTPGDWQDVAFAIDPRTTITLDPPPNFFRIRSEGIALPVRARFSFDGDRPSPDDYRFGSGGDANADGVVNLSDLHILKRALFYHVGERPEFDVNRNGTFEIGDLQLALDVYARRKPALISAVLFSGDSSLNEPAIIQARGMNFDATSKLILNGVEHAATEWFFEEDGSEVLRVSLPEPVPQTANRLAVRTRLGLTETLLFDYEPLAPSFIIDHEDHENAPSASLSAPTFQILQDEANDCCITSIHFLGAMSGLTIEAYNERGDEADGNGLALRTNRRNPVRLTGRTRQVTVIIRESGSHTPVGQFTFTCDNLKKDERYSEQMPDVQDNQGTQVRGRPLFTVVDFTVERPCELAPSTPPPVGVSVEPRDNQQWPDPADRTRQRPGSGVVTALAVPLASLAAARCEKACWAQGVTTRIDLWNAAKSRWEKVTESDWHNDNLNADPGPNGEPWYCYDASFVRNGNLVLGDGPHLVHTNVYCFGGKTVRLQPGDIIRRRSLFLSSLICYDPPPERLLASYFWSVTTTYRYDATNPLAGGATVSTPPVYVNLTGASSNVVDVADSVFRKSLDRKRLSDHLQKKERDQKRCP